MCKLHKMVCVLIIPIKNFNEPPKELIEAFRRAIRLHLGSTPTNSWTLWNRSILIPIRWHEIPCEWLGFLLGCLNSYFPHFLCTTPWGRALQLNARGKFSPLSNCFMDKSKLFTKLWSISIVSCLIMSVIHRFLYWLLSHLEGFSPKASSSTQLILSSIGKGIFVITLSHLM